MPSIGERRLAPLSKGRATHLEGLGHLFIHPTRTRSVAIDFEQDTRIGEFASRGFVFGDQLVERVALLLAQFYFVLMRTFLHGFLLER